MGAGRGVCLTSGKCVGASWKLWVNIGGMSGGDFIWIRKVSREIRDSDPSKEVADKTCDRVTR